MNIQVLCSTQVIAEFKSEEDADIFIAAMEKKYPYKYFHKSG